MFATRLFVPSMSRHVGLIALTLLLLMAGLLPRAAAAQNTDYLQNPTQFQEAWAAMQERLGGAQLFSLVVYPDRIEVEAQAAQGGPRVDAWLAYPKKGLFGGWRVQVDGPAPLSATGAVADVTQGFFAADTVDLARMPALAAMALREVPLLDPGRVTLVRVERQMALLPTPGFGDVRWQIAVGNGRERGSIEALADGTFLGADISGTQRGRNKDFRAQTDWDFARVQQGFQNIIQGRDVFEVRVRRGSIIATATAHDDPQNVRGYSWDGGRFTGGLVGHTNTKALIPNADLPFRMTEVDLGQLPSVLATARAAAPEGWRHVFQAVAAKPVSVPDAPVARWVVELVPSEAQTRERVEALVSVDGTLISLKLPPSLQPPTNYLTPAGALGALAEIEAAFGADLMVTELMFRPARVTISMLRPDDPSQVEEITLRGGEFKKGFMSMPAIMGGKPFPLGDVKGLGAAQFAQMQARAAEALQIPQGEVDSLKIWDGAPFWQSRSKIPFVDVRVSRPGSIGSGGYVVFLLDGRLVEALR